MNKCKKCGKEFISFLSETCPYCGHDNSVSFGDVLDSIFSPSPDKNKNNKKKQNKPYDPYDWDNPNNCSDREYMDDDDYDDFDN